jgi:hypothetical protein
MCVGIEQVESSAGALFGPDAVVYSGEMRHKKAEKVEERLADQIGVPDWGKALIKWLVKAAAVLVGVLAAIGVELYHLNRDVGRIQGQIEKMPQAISTSFLNQAGQLTKEGKVDEALGAVKLATAAIAAASRRNIPADPGYFTDAVRNIGFI